MNISKEKGETMKNMILTEKKAKNVLIHILLPVLIAVISFSILAKVVPESELMQSTLKSIEDSKTTVSEFTGATLAASLAVSALPDDFATPIANNFAGMSKYFVIILIALFVERLILVIGVKMSLMYVIPGALILLAIANGIKKDLIKILATKILILGIALVAVIPCSVKFTNYVGGEYLAYVDQTIEETNGGANKINDEMADGNEGTTIFEKLSDAFKTAIKGVSNLLSYFNDMVKKCMNSIVILIVTNFVMPVVTLLAFRWILKEVFGIIIPTAPVKKWVKKGSDIVIKEEAEE